MKLGDHISQRSVSLEDAATGIGDVSVSGLRKWISGERTPRPDQMRRIFEWSDGRVTPNDFILIFAGGAQVSSHGPECASAATSCPEKCATPISQGAAR